MKHTKLFIIILFAFILITVILTESKAQTTYNGNLTLTTQAEVNAFNYTEVTGWLNINGTDITDLSPLSNLVSVGGQLVIYNTSITTIDGFSSLTTAGEIFIDQNPVLQSFSDFHSLVSTLAGGNIEITNNVSLTSFSGFEVLQTVGFSFEISYNTVLTQIPDYPLLHTIASSFFIYDNPLLPEITGFNTLQSIGYSFFINENNALTEITGFNALQSVGDYLDHVDAFIISDNNALSGITGFNALQSMGSRFIITGNNALTEITGFNTLQSVGDYLDHSLGYTFIISDNNALSGITGFNALQSIETGSIIYGNNALAEFCGFYNFFNYYYSGTGSFVIFGNLVNPSIQDIINGGSCHLFIAFDDFTADELKIKIDNFKIEGNFTLGAASNGIDPLTEDVTLEVGTFTVTVPAGSFNLSKKRKFEFEGDVDGVGVKVEIHPPADDNHYFEVDVEGVDLSGTTFPVDVTLTIGDDSGTASYSGDLDKSSITQKGFGLPIDFALDQNYPNPFNPTTQIRFGLPEAGNVTLKVYNSVGQLVKTLVDGNMNEGYHLVNWDARDNNGIRLSSGIYFYTLTSGSIIESKKMVLMK